MNARKTVKPSTKKGGNTISNNSHPTGYNCTHSSGSSSGKNRSYPADSSDSRGHITELPSSPSPGASIAQYPPVDDTHIFWETSLLLPAMPDEIRQEVDLLLSDLVVRLKQLLFNSLLCAYYVGFIPMQFADVSTDMRLGCDTMCMYAHTHTQSHLSYDRWWCIEHAFLVWANSFVILSSHLLPPSYCQVLYQCALHLGCWTRCVHDGKASM